MYDFYTKRLPDAFSNFFMPINQVHNYNTIGWLQETHTVFP